MNSKSENRIVSEYNFNWFNPNCCSGKFQIPIIKKSVSFPDKIMNFCEALTSKNYSVGIHFFIDDYKFERIWNNPNRYIPILGRFQYVLSPDFSLYSNMSLALQLWNVYRSRLLGYAMQQCGINVIPSISWSNSSSFEFCFDGIEKQSIVAVSSVGTNRNNTCRKLFSQGFDMMMRNLEPKSVLFYGPLPADYQNNEKIIHFPACKIGENKVSYRRENNGR